MIPECQLEPLGRAVANVGRDDLAGGVVVVGVVTIVYSTVPLVPWILYVNFAA